MNLTDTERYALEHFVHTPIEAQAAFNQLAEMMYGRPGISLGSPLLDRAILPTRPGWIRVIGGRTSEGKSTMLRIIAKREAQRLIDNKLTDTHYVAFVSYEESVDSQEAEFAEGLDMDKFWRGQVAPNMALKASINRANLPIYWIGESMMKSSMDSQNMTINMVLAGIIATYKTEKKLPSLIVIDYAQEIEIEKQKAKRTEDVIEGMKDVIALARKAKCAIEIGSQGKEVTYDRNPPILKARDMEYSYYISQKATSVVTLWRPWVTHRDDPKIQREKVIWIPGWKEPFELSPNLTVISPAKVRKQIMWRVIPVLMDPVKLVITDLEQVERELRLK